mgnify:CR=1 FL=1
MLPLLVDAGEQAGRLKEARRLPRVRLNPREVSDLIMLAMGAFSPLRGSAFT